jgi:N6-L-threonylcarbamoyladenine synthase
MDTKRVLAIETSCDETAVARICVSGDEVIIEKHLVSSQIPIHQQYGGVVPEVAARSHVAETVSLLFQALGDERESAFDAVAVTAGPGLATALRVGVEAARALSVLSGKPLIAVNHLEGHIASAWLTPAYRRTWVFPLLALVVSGGHTELIRVNDFCSYTRLGGTRDDAAGEAFDKTAKLMGLSYPGGPAISKWAETGNPEAFSLPRPMIHEGLDMSFSGLKTAVRTLWPSVGPDQRADFAASVQEAIVDVLVEKTLRAAEQEAVKGILLVGGVAANKRLRETLAHAIAGYLPGIPFMPAEMAYITDNAAMIAAAGYWRWQKGDVASWKDLEVNPEEKLDKGAV